MTIDGDVEGVSRSSARYSRVAMWLHWLTAGLIAFNFAVGFYMEGLPQPWRGIIIPMHMSCGISVLALTIVRILWRIGHPPPLHEKTLKPLEAYLANLTHVALYGLMIAVPLSGWVIISSNPPPASDGARLVTAHSIARGEKPRRLGPREIWWTIPLPLMSYFEEMGETREGVEPQHVFHGRAVDMHEALALLMAFLLLLHISGALKHQYIDCVDELGRIGLGRGGGT